MNPTSLEEWYWIADLAGVPQPKTTIIQFPYRNVIEYLNRSQSQCSNKTDQIIFEIDLACRDMGYPVFIRTAYYSGKFDGLCYYECFDDAKLSMLLSQSIMEEKPIEAICVREMLKPDAIGYFRSGLGIGPERRYFTMDGVVSNHLPYWTRNGVDTEPHSFNGALDDAYRYINTETDEEVELLTGYCNKILSQMRLHPNLASVDWSIDFMRDRSGKWWMIDMGEAYKSWVPS